HGGGRQDGVPGRGGTMTEDRPRPTRALTVDSLPVEVHASAEHLGRAAAADMAEVIREAIAARGRARVVFACANSQLAFLRALRGAPDVDWSRVEACHMDEHVGLGPAHPATCPPLLQRELLHPVPGVPLA